APLSHPLLLIHSSGTNTHPMRLIDRKAWAEREAMDQRALTRLFLKIWNKKEKARAQSRRKNADLNQALAGEGKGRYRKAALRTRETPPQANPTPAGRCGAMASTLGKVAFRRALKNTSMARAITRPVQSPPSPARSQSAGRKNRMAMSAAHAKDILRNLLADFIDPRLLRFTNTTM
ncbi:MAG: hypothetical protein IIY17_01780, partial [Aeriscardovia sp.]|nr:hypothetical protein [Aeriscardovia sp.]